MAATCNPVAVDRLNRSQRLLVVKYEKLVLEPLTELKRMLVFLKIPIDEERLTCLSNHLTGPVKGAQRTVDPYTAEEKLAMTIAWSYMSSLLRDRGFQGLSVYPELLDLFHLSNNSTSEQLLKLNDNIVNKNSSDDIFDASVLNLGYSQR